MDLVLRNVRLVDGDAVVIVDIGVADGRIAAVEPGLNADAEEMDLEVHFAVAGFVRLMKRQLVKIARIAWAMMARNESYRTPLSASA